MDEVVVAVVLAAELVVQDAVQAAAERALVQGTAQWVEALLHAAWAEARPARVQPEARGEVPAPELLAVQVESPEAADRALDDQGRVEQTPEQAAALERRKQLVLVGLVQQGWVAVEQAVGQQDSRL